MILLTLVRWTTAFAVTWFFTANEPSTEVDLRLQEGLRWTAHDELGNSYEGFDIGGGGGNSPHWRYTSWFVPAVPAGARTLAISVTNPADGVAVTSEVPLAGA